MSLTPNKIRVAMIAPPWLSVPPEGYGGIENVIYALVPELQKLGVEVELFTTSDTRMRGVKKHCLYDVGQIEHIHRPQYDTGPITAAHMMFALNKIRQDGKFDVIHDHNNIVGPLALSHTADDIPPALHTLHNPRFVVSTLADSKAPDNIPMWKQLNTADKIYFVGMSNALVKPAPRQIKRLILPAVHNALRVKDFPFVQKKKEYFATLARFSAEKGQHIAAKACIDTDTILKMAGGVGELKTPRKVMLELANPLSTFRGQADFRYFSDKIFPYLGEDNIQYMGELSGKRKIDFIANAKALLFPIQWDEPFGMSVIESLACGTPVIAMNRGAMPEIIDHGVTGFLANTETEFKKYLLKIDEIDPSSCRKAVKERFSASVMAQNYLDRYLEVIKRQQKT